MEFMLNLVDEHGMGGGIDRGWIFQSATEETCFGIWAIFVMEKQRVNRIISV